MPASMIWKDRLTASSVHFGLCVVLALLSSFLVFGLWYPYPYREMSGGRELFLIVMGVDIVLGPLITLVIFNRLKKPAALRRDLATVVALQLLALAYGLWTVFIARPVHLVFEYDRLRVVHAAEVSTNMLLKAPADVQAMPLFGPTLLSLRPFKDEKEKFDATLAAIQGGSLSAQPELWRPYEAARDEILHEAKPVAKLKTRFAAQTSQIDQAASSSGRKADDLVYLPLVGRKMFWTVLLDPVSAQPLAFLPLDSF